MTAEQFGELCALRDKVKDYEFAGDQIKREIEARRYEAEQVGTPITRGAELAYRDSLAIIKRYLP